MAVLVNHTSKPVFLDKKKVVIGTKGWKSVHDKYLTHPDTLALLASGALSVRGGVSEATAPLPVADPPVAPVEEPPVEEPPVKDGEEEGEAAPPEGEAAPPQSLLQRRGRPSR